MAASDVQGAARADELEPDVERRSAGAYFPAMDGYRAVAALLVLLTHVALASGLVVRNTALGPYLARADVGVSIFFLLSGFLLYRPFVVAHLEGRPAGSLGGYARRRALRIIPAYWFALTIVAFVLEAPAFHPPHEVVTHYLLLHPYFLDQVTGGPIQQSWTLATEVGFYVFLPAWAWLVVRGRQRRSPERQLRAEVLGLVVLWVVPVVVKLLTVRYLNGRTGPGDLTQAEANDLAGMLGTWLPFRLDEFALGMALAVGSAWIVHRGTRLPAWTTRATTTLACWAVAAALFWFTSTQLDLPSAPIFTPRQALVVRLLYSAIALFLLLPAVFGPQDRGLVPRLFANPVLIWLGLTSYGTYIWHEAWQERYLRWAGDEIFRSPFWQMLVVTIVLTLASAALSWYLVERPALLLKGRRKDAPRHVPG
jgi:peptidoglycan/LPS O-acetylase OafA/YrhL